MLWILVFFAILFGIIMIGGAIQAKKEGESAEYFKKRDEELISSVTDSCDKLSNNKRVKELLNLLVDKCNEYQNEFWRIEISSSYMLIVFPEKKTVISVPDEFSYKNKEITEEREPIEISFFSFDIRLQERKDRAALTHLLMLECPFLEYHYYKLHYYETVKPGSRPKIKVRHYTGAPMHSRNLEEAMLNVCHRNGDTYEYQYSVRDKCPAGCAYHTTLYNSNVEKTYKTENFWALYTKG